MTSCWTYLSVDTIIISFYLFLLPRAFYPISLFLLLYLLSLHLHPLSNYSFPLILSLPHSIGYHTFKVPSGWMMLTAHFNMRCWINASSGDGGYTTVDTAMMWVSFVGQVSSELFFFCCHEYSSFDDLSSFFPDNYPGVITNLTVTHVASTSVTLKWDVSWNHWF